MYTRFACYVFYQQCCLVVFILSAGKLQQVYYRASGECALLLDFLLKPFRVQSEADPPRTDEKLPFSIVQSFLLAYEFSYRLS